MQNNLIKRSFAAAVLGSMILSSLPSMASPNLVGARPRPKPKVSSLEQYVTKKGDSLESLASRWLGDPNAWRAIVAANAGKRFPANPKAKLKPGVRIFLPAKGPHIEVRPTAQPTVKPTVQPTMAPATPPPATPPPATPPPATPPPPTAAPTAPPQLGLTVELGAQGYGAIVPGKVVGAGAKLSWNIGAMAVPGVNLEFTAGAYYNFPISTWVPLGYGAGTTNTQVPLVLQLAYIFSYPMGGDMKFEWYPFVAQDSIYYNITDPTNAGNNTSGFSFKNIGGGLGARFFFMQNLGINAQLAVMYGELSQAGYPLGGVSGTVTDANGIPALSGPTGLAISNFNGKFIDLVPSLGLAFRF